jgi:nitrate reductase gamma subunit
MAKVIFRDVPKVKLLSVVYVNYVMRFADGKNRRAVPVPDEYGSYQWREAAMAYLKSRGANIMFVAEPDMNTWVIAIDDLGFEL